MTQADPFKEFDQTIKHILSEVTQEKTKTRWVIVSLGLDVILTIIIAVIAQVAVNNSRTLARQNHNSIMLACQSVNKADAANLKLWTHLFDVSAQTPTQLTPEQKAAQDKQVADFKLYINKVFAPQKC